MKRTTQKKLLVLVAISILGSLCLTLLLQFNFNVSAALRTAKGEEVDVLKTSNVEYVDYILEDGYLISQSDDAYIIFTGIDTFVDVININISIKDNTGSDVVLDTFYTTNKNEDFNPSNMKQYIYRDPEINTKIVLKENVNNIRLDIGNKEGQILKINELKLTSDQNNQKLTWSSFTQFLIIFFLILFIGSNFIFDRKRMYELIYEYRFFIGLGFIIFATIFELTNSSLNIWGKYVDLTDNPTGLLFGKGRAIRSDEWATNTPLLLSQPYNMFHFFSDIIRGAQTNTFIVYGQPVFDVSVIFRPFHWGYLFLGTSRGMAFFWSLRWVVLFLSSFELFMIVSKQKKNYALLGAVLVTFAPIVQWFAVTSIVELLIYTNVSLLMLNYILKSNNSLIKFLCICIIYICAGGFVLTFYPSWIVPFAYVIVILAIWIIYENWGEIKLNKIDALNIVLIGCVFAFLILRIFNMSEEMIKLTMGTVYPGARFETGGGFDTQLFSSFANIFFPVKNYSGNISEQSMFFDLFPIGMILAIFVIIREKKNDILLFLLLGLSCFFALWMTVGFPGFLAKITLMSNVQASRAYAAFGVLNILLLIRSISLMKKGMHLALSAAISFIYVLIITYAIRVHYSNYASLKVLAIVVVLGWSISFVLLSQKEKNRKIVSVFIILLLIGSGVAINPIQQSTNYIENSVIGRKIADLQKEQPGKWIVEGIGLPMNNFAIMFGAPTINSTNVYPVLDRWEKLDKDNEYVDVYNRYAHIQPVLNKEEVEDKFLLLAPDAFQVNLISKDLITLDVKYILTKKNLKEYNDDLIEFIELYHHVDGYTIYEVVRK